MIEELARAAGISPSYTDYFGRVKTVSRETKIAILRAMGFEAETDRDAALALHEFTARRDRALGPVYVVAAGAGVMLAGKNATFALGYHVREFGGNSATIVAVPPNAYVCAAAEHSRAWGFTLQLYSLRSASDWGMGDFGSLARFAALARRSGAAAVGLNPLHQLHLANPAACSPYSPLSRLHLNALYVDVGAAAAMLKCTPPAVTQTDLQRVRAEPLVDYPAVAALKIGALTRMHAEFLQRKPGTRQARQFSSFKTRQGESLRRMALYEALNAHFREADPNSYGWLQWPAPYQNPDSPQTLQFGRDHAAELDFYCFLQWLADVQLAKAADCAKGMQIGLYRDLAVGVDANSVDVWADKGAFCLGISAGAPPDELNTEGQSWGLPPFNPHALRDRAYRPFIDVVRANMRHAGALRIDHVMGLRRLFCIPAGAPATEGAYVDFPLDDLAGILTLESRLNRCMIVGEDLGTVPPGFREHMARRRIFSCRLLYFEREDGGAFRDPREYPHDAVVSTGTHDLPPLLGYWHAQDAHSRDRLRSLLEDSGAEGTDLDFVSSVYRTLARTRAGVVLLQMEDALLQAVPVNVPGTTSGMPNWRRKLQLPVESMKDDVRFSTIVDALRRARSAEVR